MACPVCADKGLVRISYRSGEPDEFALCLCAAGAAWRNDRNAGRQTFPLWHLWAAREEVEQERVGPIEEFYESDELARMFPHLSAPAAAVASSLNENAVIEAVRQRRVRL